MKGCIRTEDTGSFLSGGLDSSVICAMASGHVSKLKTFSAGLKGAPDLEFAQEAVSTIPDEYKIYDNTEKWILRKAMEGLLPEKILMRKKAKFWEGAGVKELLSDYAGNNISDNDFRIERNLSNGQIINSKEELLYYRIFREHFGSDIDLSWMGRTKAT